MLLEGTVSDEHSELGPLVSSCCDLINVKLSVDDEEEGEDVIDSIEAVTLGPEGIYPSLIGMLVIIIHPHSAQMMTMNQAHVVFQSFATYNDMSLLVSRSGSFHIARGSVRPRDR